MRQDVCNNGRHGLTWEQLVAAEPRLASLLEEVRAARLDDGDEFDLEGVWGRFKDRIAGKMSDNYRWHKSLVFRNLSHFCEFRLELGLWIKIPVKQATFSQSANRRD